MAKCPRCEDPAFLPSAREKLLDVYRSLCKADTFERFLGAKFRTTKRFGCDGGEAAIAGVDAAIARAVELGVTEVVIGMPHRGRLNVLTNIVGKPLTQMFAEFKGTPWVSPGVHSHLPVGHRFFFPRLVAREEAFEQLHVYPPSPHWA